MLSGIIVLLLLSQTQQLPRYHYALNLVSAFVNLTYFRVIILFRRRGLARAGHRALGAGLVCLGEGRTR